MKIKFNKDDLLHASRTTQSMIPPATSLPILANILVKAEKDDVNFFACDMESAVTCTVKAEVEQEGQITIPANTFATLVRELPDAEISMYLDEDENLHIEAPEHTSYQLQTMPAAEFPVWSDVKPQAIFQLDQEYLKKMIEKTIFAIPAKDPRKVLLGSYLTIDKEIPEFLENAEIENPIHIRLVSTDGRKLAYIDALGDNFDGNAPASAIIPYKVLDELRNILGDEGRVEIGIGERQVYFKFRDTVLKTNIIEGDYPNYDMVIPSEFVYHISVNKEEFIRATRRAAIISESQNNSIIFRFGPGEVELEAMTFDLGHFSGSVPIEYDGKKFQLAFNHRYLQEVLNVTETEKITLHLKDPGLPVIFHEDDRPETLFLVMPIRMSQQQEEGEAE